MNLNHIAAIDKYITMVTGERIPVSRGKQKEFLEYYHDFTRRKLYGD